MSGRPEDQAIWPWLLAGGAAGAAVLWWWRREAREAPRNEERYADRTPATDVPAAVGLRGVFPVPIWRGRRAEISDGFSAQVVTGPRAHRKHLGADIMFRRRSRGELVVEYPPGSPNGSRGYFMPPGHPVVAAADGVVWSAARTPRGHQIVLSHGAPWATLYQHLESLYVQPTARGASGERVRAGQPLGVIGGNPELAPHLRHLHFEIWFGGAGDHAIDPRPYLDRWPHIPEPARDLRAEA